MTGTLSKHRSIAMTWVLARTIARAESGSDPTLVLENALFAGAPVDDCARLALSLAKTTCLGATTARIERIMRDPGGSCEVFSTDSRFDTRTCGRFSLGLP